MGEQKRKNSYFKDAEEDLKIICDQLPDTFEEVTETRKVLGSDLKKMKPTTNQVIVDSKHYRISYTKLKKVSHFHRLKDFILENLSEENEAVTVHFEQVSPDLILYDKPPCLNNNGYLYRHALSNLSIRQKRLSRDHPSEDQNKHSNYPQSE